MSDKKLPFVEIFETIEGEGTRAGHVTTFVRLFGCQLRCTWCDTKYSYAPSKPEFFATVEEIANEVATLGNPYVCLTGGEPLMFGEQSLELLAALAGIVGVRDIHVETSGAIDLSTFEVQRWMIDSCRQKVRFIMDWKLAASGENAKMMPDNLRYLKAQDELKFVVANADEFSEALGVVERYKPSAQVLYSPVFGVMEPKELAELVIRYAKDARLNLQQHKIIWDPSQRGV